MKGDDSLVAVYRAGVYCREGVHSPDEVREALERAVAERAVVD